MSLLLLTEAEAKAQGPALAERTLVPPSQLHRGSVIGKGGFSCVYRCEHAGVEYALKQMHKAPPPGSQKDSFAQAQMASTELDAFESISPHPFVVGWHTAWQDDRSVYLLLELCAVTLYDTLFLHGDKSTNRLPEHSTKIYVGSVALALRHLYRHGFVFRDLKLENVLLTSQGRVKLADLGSTKRLGKAGKSADGRKGTGRRFSGIGTESYLPPEQWSGKGRNEAGDLWALGVLSYELLMGEPGPFGHDEETSPSRFELDMPPPASPSTPKEKVAAFADDPEASREALRQKVLGAREELGDGGAAAASDFVVALLQPCEESRLGCASFESLLEHAWFDAFDWVRSAPPAPGPHAHIAILSRSPRARVHHHALTPRQVALLEQRMPPPFVPPHDAPADISEQIMANGEFAELIPREVDDVTQALYAQWGPVQCIGSELEADLVF